MDNELKELIEVIFDWHEETELSHASYPYGIGQLIEEQGIPRKACIDLISFLYNNGHLSEFIKNNRP